MIYSSDQDISAVARIKKSWAYRLAFLCGTSAFQVNHKRNRKNSANRRRERGWALRQMDEMPDALFKRMFRLDRDTFYKVKNLLADHMVKKNEQQAINSSGSMISIKAKFAMTLRWLAGGSYLDICFAFAVSDSSFFGKDGCLWSTIQALDNCLPLEFPFDSPEDLNRLSSEFGMNSDGSMNGCVGAIDGLLIKTRAPFLSEHSNPSSFKNRKCCYGILALAIADLSGKFLMFNVNNTGSTHDSIAWEISAVKKKIADGDLPEDLFLIGDEAFSCTNQMQSPWPGRGIGRWKDSYNYHLSSSRQCVERAFGIYVKRWGILQRRLACDFERWSLVATVCAKLHNVCCDSNIPAPSRWMEDVRPEDLPIVFLNDDNEEFVATDKHIFRAPNGLVNRRHNITEWLEAKGIGRPVHNCQSKEFN